MNVEITWNGTDITTSVIEYSREQDICNGSGTVDMTVEAVTAREFEPWDTIIIYENGDKIAEYNIASAEETLPNIVYEVSCQDDSKKLTDYFIDEQYLINYSSTCKYWIEKFLNEAGVSYNIYASGNGSELSDNTTLGVSSAYDAIIQLMQMSGWYFYFDENNVCQIGSLDVDGENIETFNDEQILKIGYLKNDKMLRNRVVVWGAADNNGNWIFADTSTITAWNRPDGDYRTTVYTNSAIKTFGIAYNLAYKILNEFSKTLPEGHLQVTDSHSNVTLGKRITGTTSQLSISGMVTHIQVNMSSEGLTSTYTLDQRCPRLFGYASWNDWVYVGTIGNGVWRKYIKSATWYNYSTGITNLNIKDLSAYDGMLGCIGNTTTEDVEMDIGAKLYLRHSSLASWSSYTPAGFTNSFVPSGEGYGIEYLTSGIVAEASSIDRYYGINGMITAGYTIPNPSGMAELLASGMAERRHDPFPASGNLSWVTGVTLGGYPIYTQQVVVISGETPKVDYGIIDLETNWDGNNLVSVYAGMEKEITVWTPSGAYVDYGNTNLGGEHLYLTNGVYEGSSTSLKTYLPPATSGIFVEMNTDVMSASGWWSVYNYNPDYVGAVYIDGSIPPNGAMYTCTIGEYGGIQEKLFYTVSGEYGQEPVGGRSWAIEGLWNDGDEQYIVNFYKTGNNAFSILYWDGYGYFATKFITVEDIAINASGIGTVESTNEQDISYDFYYVYNEGGLNYTQRAISQNGGRFYAVCGACGSPGAGVVSMGVCVIDMTTGNINSDDLMAISSTEKYAILGEVGQNTNYIVFGGIYYPPITSHPATSYTWNLYTAVVNKTTGAISTSYTDLETHYSAYTDLNTTASWLSKGDAPHVKRNMFLLPADDSTARGLIYVNLQDNIGFGHNHWLLQVQRILVNLSTGSCGSSSYDDYWTNEDGGVWSMESLAWMHAVNNAVETGGPNTYDNKQIMGIYGDANITFCQYYRTDIDDDYEYEYAVFLNSSDFEDYTVINFPPTAAELGATEELGVTSIAFCNGVQGEDGLIYMAAIYHMDPPPYFDYLTLGYDTEGVIKKVGFVGYDMIEGHPEWGVWWTYGGTGKIFGNKYGYDYFDDTYGWDSNWIAYFYEPSGATLETSTHNYQILFHNPNITPSGQFTVIYEYGMPMYIDTAKNVPTVIYTKPALDDYPSAMIARSFLNEWNSFDRRSPGGGMGVHDVRAFDLSDPLGYFPVSGVASGFLDRFIGIAGGHVGAVMLNSELDPYEDYAVICSGNFTHLDFTNNDPDPYIFVSTSGTATTSGRFLQKNTQSYVWNDYSVGLPSGVITIIRADDRM